MTWECHPEGVWAAVLTSPPHPQYPWGQQPCSAGGLGLVEQMLLLGITDFCRCARDVWKHLKRLEVFLVLPSGGGGSAGGKEGSAWFGHTRWCLHVTKGPLSFFMMDSSTV